MKKILMLFFLLAGLVFPWACSDNNSPSKPSGPAVGGSSSLTFTPTGTAPTATFTGTPTPTGGFITFTPTTTWTPRPTPAYDNNYGTSAAPNGMYYDGFSILYTAEAESKGGTIVNALEQFTNGGGGALAFGGMGNQYIVGQATPCAVYQPTPQIYALTLADYPVGVAVSSPFGPVGAYPGEIEVLDAPTSGSATLYVGNNYNFCISALIGGPFMNITNGFGGDTFNNPKCLTADSLGHFYVADTGDGYVEEFDGGGALCSPLCSPAWLHRWNGPGSGFSPNMTFKVPNSLATDTGNNVYVGDSGPYVNSGVTTSMVQVYTSGGTSIVGTFFLLPGCVVNGLAADSAGDFFVSDTNNGEIEEYQMLYSNGTPWTCCAPPTPSGTVLTQLGLVRAWGDPHGYHEFAPYTPSCIQFLPGGYVVSGDTGNDFLNVFGPLL